MIEPKFILFNRGERDITFQALGITLKLVLVVGDGGGGSVEYRLGCAICLRPDCSYGEAAQHVGWCGGGGWCY